MVEYFKGLPAGNLRTLVKALNSLEQLQQMAQLLASKSIEHALWIEQPENVPTAIAIVPVEREKVHAELSHLPLFK